VKAFVIITAIFATAFSCFANTTNSLEKFSPHFSANTKILWQATNRLPESIWTYKRLPPRPFLASVISNAVILASMQDKQIPKPSTNEFFISSFPNPCCMGFTIFSIQPTTSTITFSSTNQIYSTNDVPDDETVTRRAFECAARLGLGRAYLIPKNVYNASNVPGRTDIFITNGICARGIYLSRKLDGIGFFGDANENSEGFSIEFGSHGQTRSFELVWPNLKPDQSSPTASRAEIIRCILAQRIIVIPNADEETYFQRVEGLANARTFTITQITPYYGEGVFGETPTNDAPSEFITPLAELKAIADFGNSNAAVRFLSPILSSEISRLLAK
jgi:hypothetical protein